MAKRKEKNDPFDIKLGFLLSEARKKKNISQEEIANALGVSKMSVSRWESGENRMFAKHLKQYCKYIDEDVESFFNKID